MNLDLLKKLTRLANNNPNDNEANLAARKVCKMLEESNWSLASNNSVNTVKQQPQQPRTWADVTRSSTPEWKSTQQAPSSGKPFEWYDLIRDLEKGFFSQQRPQRDNPFWDNKKSWFDENKTSYTYKPKPEIKEIECTQCHKKIETGYVGTPGTFVCNTCRWENYNKGVKNEY